MKDDNLYVIRELYENEKTTNEVLMIANRYGYQKNIDAWCDSAEPDRIKEIQQDGFTRAKGVVKEPNSINAQLDWLKGREIYIHHSCVNAIKEISQYKWKIDKDGKSTDKPVDFFDDFIAAMRYGIEGWRKKKEIVVKSKDIIFGKRR